MSDSTIDDVLKLQEIGKLLVLLFMIITGVSNHIQIVYFFRVDVVMLFFFIQNPGHGI